MKSGKKVKWTVFRDVAYNLGPFFEKHPGGNWLLNLAVGRDCTALIESYHLRPEVASARFKMLPKLEGFPDRCRPEVSETERFAAVQQYSKPRPRGVVPRGGQEQAQNGWRSRHRHDLGLRRFRLRRLRHRTGIPVRMPPRFGRRMDRSHDSALRQPRSHVSVSGCQRCPRFDERSHRWFVFDVEIPPSSEPSYPLQRQRHGSRCLHCHASLAFRCSQTEGYHRFQHLYMFLAFPMLQVAFQVGDIVGLFTRDTEGAKLHGATMWELATVVIGKIVHFGLLAAPMMNHAVTSVLAGIVGFMACQGVVLACTFAVSHNVPEAKIPEDTGGEAWERDWGVQQLVTSADWGGKIGNFFTGGPNLQIEHHLFPAICFVRTTLPSQRLSPKRS